MINKFESERNRSNFFFRFFIPTRSRDLCSIDVALSHSRMCTLKKFRMPFVETGFLLIASQYDEYQLLYDILGDPSTGPEYKYAIEWVAETKAAPEELATNVSRPSTTPLKQSTRTRESCSQCARITLDTQIISGLDLEYFEPSSLPLFFVTAGEHTEQRLKLYLSLEKIESQFKETLR